MLRCDFHSFSLFSLVQDVLWLCSLFPASVNAEMQKNDLSLIPSLIISPCMIAEHVWQLLKKLFFSVIERDWHQNPNTAVLCR